MVQIKVVLWLVVTLAILLVAGCGGGAGNSASGAPPNPVPSPTPQGDFALQLEFSQVSLQQQGIAGSLVVFVTRSQGFSGAITVSLQGLPQGVAASPVGSPTLVSGSSNQGVVFQLSAASSAAVATTAFNIAGTSGSLSHTVAGQVAVTPAAPFSLSLSPSPISVTPGTSTPISVTLNVNSSPSPTVFLTATGPANSGITLLVPQNGLVGSQTVTATIDAQMIASALQSFPVTFTATDDSTSPAQTSIRSILLSVNVPFTPIAALPRSTFVVTQGDPTDAVYDPVRKLVFTTINSLNEVRVFSADGILRAVIPTPFPQGIDISADGAEIFVGSSQCSRISVIDPVLLQIVKTVPGPVLASAGPVNTGQAYPREIRTLASGKALLLTQVSNTGENHIFVWDPATGTIVQNDPSTTFSVTGIVRSGDHTRAFAIGDGFPIAAAAVSFYDLAGDSFGPINNLDAAKFVMNNDGSRIAAQSTGDLRNMLFLDGQLNQLASVPALSGSGTSEPIYGLDGKRLYVLADYFNVAHVIDVFDATTFSPLGITPDISIGNSFFEIPYAIDETGMIFRGDQSGLAFVDASAPGTFGIPIFNFSSQAVSPQLVSPVSPTAATLSGAFHAPANRVFIGPAPASSAALEASITGSGSFFTQINIPPSSVLGPANVTVTRADGWYAIDPAGVSFGPEILFSLGAGPVSGGTSTSIYGYGLSSSSTQVSVGGNPSASVQASASVAIPPVNVAKYTVPAGAPGLADVTVTTPKGTFTEAGGYQYLNQAQVFPVAGTLNQIIYDQPRQRLYATNITNNRVEVFSLATQTFQSPIPVGSVPTGIAQTPDGTLLAVTNFGDGTVSVIDPDQGLVVSTFSVVVPSDLDPNFCAGRVVALTPVKPHRMLVQINCTNLLDNGHLRLVDLGTGNFNCAGVVNCDPNGIDIDFGSGLAPSVSSIDGSKVLLAQFDISSGQTGLWDVDANQILIRNKGQLFEQVSMSRDGTTISANAEVMDSLLNFINIPQDPFFLSALANSSTNNTGSKLSPSGSLFFLPQTSNTVDVFDVHRGRLALRITLPEAIPSAFDPMVLDETGNRLFLISQSGIMLAQLVQSPLSIARVLPASGPAGATVAVRGSGFQNGATVSFGNAQVSASFIDSNTLNVVVPAITAGPVRVGVRNPDGKLYTFDAAFTLN